MKSSIVRQKSRNRVEKFSLQSCAFGKEMRRLGLPFPRADQQAIAELAA